MTAHRWARTLRASGLGEGAPALELEYSSCHVHANRVASALEDDLHVIVLDRPEPQLLDMGNLAREEQLEVREETGARQELAREDRLTDPDMATPGAMN